MPGPFRYFLFVILSASLLTTVDPCVPPQTLADSREPNIFVNGLEADLGDVLADGLERLFPMIREPSLTAHLNRVGQRVAAHVPEGQSYRFYMIALPDVQAFTLPGGRIYVSRKLVAFVKSQDELAGILAHEIGHAASHQGAIQMTRVMRLVLGVQTVQNRQDVIN